MPRLSEDASTMLRHMKALGAKSGDCVLVDMFARLFDDNEHRAVSALDELIKRKLAVGTPDRDALTMTKSGAGYQASE
jgi:hypothetical protein